ncbi:Alanine racemase [compost metagenome]
MKLYDVKKDDPRSLRPSWAEIDHDAIRSNMVVARSLIPASTKIYMVCKGDGYGFGAATVAKLAAEAGADGLCVGSPEEGVAIRNAGVDLEVLLFASTLPEDTVKVASLGLTLTIESLESLEAFIACGVEVNAFVEIDPGFGRFGLLPEQWAYAFESLKNQTKVKLRGIYAHLSSPDDNEVTKNQVAVFNAALQKAEAAGFSDLMFMLASSRVMMAHPSLAYGAVDPGRLLYGALDGSGMDKLPLKPMLKAVRGRIVHVQEHLAGSVLGVGYGTPIVLEKNMKIGVVPIGFGDGLNHIPPLGNAIVNGVFAPVLGRRSLQHSMLDLTHIPSAEIGTVATFLGEDGDCRITLDEVAGNMNVGVLELTPRLAKNLPHLIVSDRDK